MKRRAPLDDLANKLIGKMSAALANFARRRPTLMRRFVRLAVFLAGLINFAKKTCRATEKKFKDRLNDQVSQEIALFNTELARGTKAYRG